MNQQWLGSVPEDGRQLLHLLDTQFLAGVHAEIDVDQS